MHAVTVKNITKIYKLYEDKWGPIKEVVTRRPMHREFKALRDVSLDFPSGESIGVLGKNGSGKSTLLKIITGIAEPTSGTVEVNGSLVFLDVSSGIDAEMTGYENIFMKGTLLGYSKEEMMEKVDDIIAFSELEEFIHQPVKNYSSGMRAKLGFAISVNVNPDILIVDEALAVGDSVFREKCMRKMNEFKDDGKTIIFVSHDKNAVENFCTKAAWIHQGELIMYGDSKMVGSYYNAFMSGKQSMESIKAQTAFSHAIESIKLTPVVAPRKNEHPASHGETSALFSGSEVKNNSTELETSGDGADTGISGQHATDMRLRGSETKNNTTDSEAAGDSAGTGISGQHQADSPLRGSETKNDTTESETTGDKAGLAVGGRHAADLTESASVSKKWFSLEVKGYIYGDDADAEFSLVVRNVRTGECVVVRVERSRYEGSGAVPVDRRAAAGFVAVVDERDEWVFTPDSYGFFLRTEAGDETLEFPVYADAPVGLDDANEQAGSLRFPTGFSVVQNGLVMKRENVVKLEQQTNAVRFDGQEMVLEGIAFARGQEVPSAESVRLRVVLKETSRFDVIDVPTEVVYTDEVTEKPAFNPNGRNYNYAGFSARLDAAALEPGTYDAYVMAAFADGPEVCVSMWASKQDQYDREPHEINGRTITLHTENKYVTVVSEQATGYVKE